MMKTKNQCEDKLIESMAILKTKISSFDTMAHTLDHIVKYQDVNSKQLAKKNQKKIQDLDSLPVRPEDKKLMFVLDIINTNFDITNANMDIIRAYVDEYLQRFNKLQTGMTSVLEDLETYIKYNGETK